MERLITSKNLICQCRWSRIRVCGTSRKYSGQYWNWRWRLLLTVLFFYIIIILTMTKVLQRFICLRVCNNKRRSMSQRQTKKLVLSSSSASSLLCLHNNHRPCCHCCHLCLHPIRFIFFVDGGVALSRHCYLSTQSFDNDNIEDYLDLSSFPTFVVVAIIVVVVVVV